MFAHRHFASRFFASRYFPPTTQIVVIPPVTTTPTAAGGVVYGSRKRRVFVETDGKEYEVESEAHAYALLEQLQAQYQKRFKAKRSANAQTIIDHGKPVIKVENVSSQVTAYAGRINKELEQAYFRFVQYQLLLRLEEIQELEEEEFIILYG